MESKFKPGDWVTQKWKKEFGGEQDFLLIQSISDNHFSPSVFYRFDFTESKLVTDQKITHEVSFYSEDPRLEFTLRILTSDDRRKLKYVQNLSTYRKFGL